MRFNTLVGILAGLAAILGAFYIEKGDFTKLILPAPLLIVIGGTLMAGLASTSWRVFSKIFKLIWISFWPANSDKKKITMQILEYSLMSRKFGMLSLEPQLKRAEHPYIRKIFQVGLDGADIDTLTDIYYAELHGINYRHSENIALFHKLGALSPTMGIIGTVMGLISTMSEAGANGDANRLIISISVAFLATLWGIVLANIVWIPIGDRLQTIHNEEQELLDLIFSGAKCVFSGDSPTVVVSKLSSNYPILEQPQFNKEARTFIERQRTAMQNTNSH